MWSRDTTHLIDNVLRFLITILYLYITVYLIIFILFYNYVFLQTIKRNRNLVENQRYNRPSIMFQSENILTYSKQYT